MNNFENIQLQGVPEKPKENLSPEDTLILEVSQEIVNTQKFIEALKEKTPQSETIINAINEEQTKLNALTAKKTNLLDAKYTTERINKMNASKDPWNTAGATNGNEKRDQGGTIFTGRK